MNVLLVNPASPHIVKISRGFDLPIESIGRFPPVGLMAVAAYIRTHSHHRVTIKDCDAEQITFEALIAYIEAAAIHVVGITVFTYTFYDVLQLARAIKQRVPNVRIVLGGAHTLLFAHETLLHPKIDYLIIGEGEIPFLYLLNCLEQGQEPDKIDGLGLRREGEIMIGPPHWIDDLDTLPFPAYDLIQPDLYHATVGCGGRTLTLNSSRGCPFHCTFCQVLVKKYRAHSIPYLLQEITHFYQQGYRNYYFFDDLFNATATRILDFSKAIRQAGLDITWIFRGRVNHITKELCQEAALAGCVQILFGIEDYTNENLRTIKKHITIEQAKSAIDFARQYGITTSTNWILGLPTHTSLQDIENLIQVAIELDSDYAMFTILQLLPGCEMFEQAVAEGVIRQESWAEFVKQPTPSYHVEAYEKYLSLGQLETAYADAYRRYYQRPRYLIRRVLALRNLSQLLNQLPVALKIFFGRKRKRRAK